MTAPHDLWIGTYPAQGSDAGSGEGVWRVRVEPDGTFGEPALAAVTPAPSFVALHPSGRTLYAVAEQGRGTVSAFPVLDDGGLGEPVTVGSGGDSPCHLLALDGVLWIANYMDGVAASIRVDPTTGAFVDDAVSADDPPAGSGPHADRQEGPHAHFCAAVGDDVLVVDLGLDVIRRYRGRRANGLAAEVPPGTGPRHLVARPDGALAVAGELDVRLHVLAPGDAAGADAAPASRAVEHGWAPSSSVPAALTAAPDGVLALPSHLTTTGDLLLLGVRGVDVLAAHRWTPSGEIEPLADTHLGAGAFPRHHEVVGEAADGRLLVVVARQGTNDLAAVLVDPATGKGEIVDTVALPTPPSCVVVA